jgi:phospholipid/cholesterol/gamma-HCH transport system permease protein
MRIACPPELTQTTGKALLAEVTASDLRGASDLVLDFSNTQTMDARGGAWVTLIAEAAHRHDIALTWEGHSGQVASFLELIAPSLHSGPPPKPKPASTYSRLVDTVAAIIHEARDIRALCIDTIYWTFLAPFEGRGFRWELFLDQMHEIGVRAVGIVFLMNFLLGLTIAMLSAAQLADFGVALWVADLVMIGFARELAAVMTGVVMSARSGAAITAEISTMKVQEEVDALNAMGISTTQYLVTPRLLAMVVCMPCLTILGMIAGILGGALWGVAILDIRLSVWMEETLLAAYFSDVMQGVIKAFVFANIIVFVGCHNGFRVRGGSRGVGLMTTRAVVMDIFFIVLIDMIFATFFYYILG